jgi:outer membrane protein X
MKRLYIFLFVSLMLSSVANAQNYDKFKLGLGAGYAGGKGAEGITAGGGVLLTLEPAYRVSDNLAIGLRLEGAAYGSSSSSGWPGGIASLTINGQYYFDAGLFRPFVGAGLGGYLGSDLSAFGFYPRLGLDWGHFTLAFEYNLIPGGSSDYDYLTNTSSATSAYYFGIRVGGYFFGGKK